MLMSWNCKQFSSYYDCAHTLHWGHRCRNAIHLFQSIFSNLCHSLFEIYYIELY